MPMVMKNADWMRAVANVSRADGVWFQDVSSGSGTIPLEIPEAGRYQVILVKIDKAEDPVPSAKKPRIADFIGYGAKFHTPRPTEEWMKELREAEEE